jgi:hypothetical protein
MEELQRAGLVEEAAGLSRRVARFTPIGTIKG